MGKKLSFKGKNRVLSFLVKSSFPENAHKKACLVTCIEVDHAIVIPDHESRPDFVIEGKEPVGVWQEDGAELQVGLLDIPPDHFLVG